MATKQEIREAAKAVESLGDSFTICRDVAIALIDTGQTWLNDNFMDRLFCATEYEKARKKIGEQITESQNQLKKVRDTELSPEAIRAAAYVEQIKKTCEQCPEHNKKRIEEGQKFVCLMETKLSKGTFRFRLNEKGKIIES